MQLLVKNYLDKLVRNVRRFKNNFQGSKLYMAFYRGAKTKITNRMCENIRRSVARTSKEIIEEYFTNLSEVLKLKYLQHTS